MWEPIASYKGLREEVSNNSDLYVLYFYIWICIMSVNVHVQLYLMISYIVQVLTEAIFLEVDSIARDDGFLNVL